MLKLASFSNRVVVAVVIVAAIMAGVAPLGRASAQSGTATVTCVAEDIHSSPDIYASKVATLYQNQSVSVGGTTSAQGASWTAVYLSNGASGWVKSVCLQATSGQSGSSQGSSTGAYGVVITGALNIRSGPGAQYASIFSVYRGTVLYFAGTRSADNRWVKVSLNNGVVGWVNVGYLSTGYPYWTLPVEGGQVPTPTQPPSGAYATVTTGALNVRSGPGWWYGTITSLYRGTTASLLSRNADGSWVKISLANGQTGWVNAGYITANVGILSLPVESATVPTTPTVPTYPTYPTYPTVPTYPTYPTTTCRAYHTITRGENLFRISLAYNVSLYTLAAVNGIYDTSRIYAGQQLCIP